MYCTLLYIITVAPRMPTWYKLFTRSNGHDQYIIFQKVAKIYQLPRYHFIIAKSNGYDSTIFKIDFLCSFSILLTTLTSNCHHLLVVLDYCFFSIAIFHGHSVWFICTLLQTKFLRILNSAPTSMIMMMLHNVEMHI